MSRIAILVLAAIMQAPGAQYFVELREEPAAGISFRSPARGTRNEAVRLRGSVRGRQARIRAAIGVRDDEVRQSFDLLLNGFVAEMSAERAQRLAGRPEVKSVTGMSTRSGFTMDTILPLINAPRAWELAPEGTSQGAGVKIGVIDSTLDVSHPAFQDPDLTMPPGFPKGNDASDLAKTNSKVIVYRTYGNTSDFQQSNSPYHGTVVAMTAAGARYESPIGPISGVAPKAWIGFYHLGDVDNPRILRAMEDAVADGMDVLNLSVGFLQFAGAEARRPFEAAAERAMRLGTAIAWAAANSGPERTTLLSHSLSDANLVVGGTKNTKFNGGTLQLESGQTFGVIPVPEVPDSIEPVRARLRDVRELDRATGGCNPLPEGSLQGRIALADISAPCAAGRRIASFARAGVAALLFYQPEAELTGGGTIGQIPPFPAAQISARDAAELIRLGPSSLDAVLTIARQPQPADSSLPYALTSAGPTLDYRIRPDVSAVAQFVYAALPNGLAGSLSGTSLSTPQVAGGMALLKAARPALTPPQLYSLVTNTAAPMPSPVMVNGSGRMDLEAAMRAVLTALPRSLSFGISSTVGTGSIDQTRAFAITKLGGPEQVVSFSVETAEGQPVPVITPAAVTVGAGESARVSVRLAVSNQRAAEYSGAIIVTGTSSGTRLRVPYWFAIPSGVPATIKVISTEEFIAGGTYRVFGRLPMIRVVDTTGIPITNVEPRVTASGVASLLFLAPNPEVPAVYTPGLSFSATPGEALLRIQAGNVVKDVTLHTATPVNPRLEFSDFQLNFGGVLTGLTKELDLPVSNPGGQPLTISGATFSNPRFSMVTRLPVTIARGARESLRIRFAPTAVADEAGRLTVIHNDLTQTGLAVAVSGTGVPAAGPLTLQVDNGTAITGIGYPNGEPTAMFVNRLTPPKYPAVLQSVQIYFRDRADGLARTTPITVIARPNPDGTERLRDVVFQRVSGTVAQLNAFNAYTFPANQALRIESGDFVVGFQANNPPRTFPAELDRTAPPQRRSYVGSESRPFSLVDTDAGIPGNFMIRAVVTFPQ